jgi:hypothetical protein
MRSATVPVILSLVAVWLLASPAALGQTGSQLLLRPFRTTDQLELDAGSILLFRTETDNETPVGDEFDFRADIYEVTGRLRLTPGLEERGIARAQPRAGFATRYLQLHTGDPSLPEEMFDGSVAVAMGVLSHEGWLGGISLGAGHAGAEFEEDANALYFQGNFAVGKTFDNGDAFGLVLDYNGNRTFMPDVPLPGFQYRKRFGIQRPPAPDQDDQQARQALEDYDPAAAPARLVLALGFPFSGIEWRPTDRLTVEATYAIPQNLTARADYTLIGDPEVSGAGIYASLSRTVTAVHWNELPGRDRLFFRQTQAEAGVNWRLDDRLEVVIAGGWAFGQEFVTGWDTRNTDDVAEVEAAPYARALVRLRL